MSSPVLQVMTRRSMADGTVQIGFKRYNHPGRWYAPTPASIARHTALVDSDVLRGAKMIWGTTKYYPVIKETE